jgi:hypothetical protein
MPATEKQNGSKLAALTAEVEGLQREVHALASQVQGIADRLASAGRTQWSALASWAGIILAIVGGVGGAILSGYTRDQGRLEGAVGTLDMARIDAARESGGTQEKVHAVEDRTLRNRDRIEAASKELDDKLQREMRLIDETTRSQLEALDHRMQNEVALMIAAQTQKIEQLGERFDVQESWIKSMVAERWTKPDHQRFEDEIKARIGALEHTKGL